MTRLPSCCLGWGEVRDGDRVVACPTCYPDAYEMSIDPTPTSEPTESEGVGDE